MSDRPSKSSNAALRLASRRPSSAFAGGLAAQVLSAVHVLVPCRRSENRLPQLPDQVAVLASARASARDSAVQIVEPSISRDRPARGTRSATEPFRRRSIQLVPQGRTLLACQRHFHRSHSGKLPYSLTYAARY
jgi:hypothetical protein